jgi:hypothetical protein
MICRSVTATIAALFALAAAGCGPKFQHTTPKGFVELEDQDDYDYRAVTADGLVVAVRAIDHEPKGEISFWTEAVINHMRQRGGYALLDRHDVKTSSGLPGTQLRFGHDEGQQPHLYWVTLFVTEDTIYVLEAGGTREQMAARETEISEAVQSFRPD